MKTYFKSNVFARFLVNAGLLYLLLFFLHQFVVRRHSNYDQKFIGEIIRSCNFVLTTFGFKTFMFLQDQDLQVIGIDGSNGVWVGSNCNAITLFSLFAVFILAFPGNQKNKIWFIPAGILCIHLLNILRVVALALVANYAPAYLNFNHTYTFTFLIYLFIFLLWVLWVNKFSGVKKTDEVQVD